MKRIQMALAALAIVVTSLAAFAVPALADDLDCRDAKGDLIRCDGDLYAPYDSDYYYDDYSPFYNYGDYEGDFEDYLDDREDAFEDYLDYVEDNYGEGYYYNW